MKTLVSFSLFIFYFVLNLNSQPPTYDDLIILHADGNFEKLIKESTKYSEKENSKNDAIVYYWLAKGYYKISFVADRDEDYKNAFKDCFTAIGKCLGKDKDGKVLAENAEFFSEVKKTLIETIRNDLDAKDYRKAAGWASKVYKITPNDIGAKYLEGACKFRVQDKGGANALWKESETLLSKIKSVENFKSEDLELFRIGVLETVECYLAMKQVEKAKTLMGKVAQWFQNDEIFKAKYDTIIN